MFEDEYEPAVFALKRGFRGEIAFCLSVFLCGELRCCSSPLGCGSPRLSMASEPSPPSSRSGTL